MSNVAKIVTDTIINKMKEAEKKGVMFRWIKPFAVGAPDQAYAYDTQQAYRGINRLLLDNNEYLTYNKVQKLNEKKENPQYQIRKGARSNIVCYYNTTPVIDEQTGKPMIDEETGMEVKKGFLKYYRVFNREDIIRKDNGENLPSKFNFKHYTHDELTEEMTRAIDRFNRLFNYYCQKNGIKIEIIKDGTQAYFSSDMKIRVPEMSNFISIYDWVHTLAHEMAHSTGVFLGRFDNQISEDIEKSMHSYSKEELVAEITAEIIASELHIPDDSPTPDNAVAYIQSWSEHLENKPNEIISAAAKAEKASEFILDCLRELEHDVNTKEREEIDNER